jgi:hypothetical protein
VTSPSKWDEKTRQAYSAKEAELDEFLVDDYELNMTNEPTSARSAAGLADFMTPAVASLQKVPTLYMDSDSVSTFHPVTPSTGNSVQPSTVFQPRVINPNPNHNTSSQPAIEIDTDLTEDVSKISDTESKISNIEGQLLQFQKGFLDLKKNAKKESLRQSKMLSHILSLLGGDTKGDAPSQAELSVPSDSVNLQDQMSPASGFPGTAGSGS